MKEEEEEIFKFEFAYTFFTNKTREKNNPIVYPKISTSRSSSPSFSLFVHCVFNNNNNNNQIRFVLEFMNETRRENKKKEQKSESCKFVCFCMCVCAYVFPSSSIIIIIMFHKFFILLNFFLLLLSKESWERKSSSRTDLLELIKVWVCRVSLNLIRVYYLFYVFVCL